MIASKPIFSHHNLDMLAKSARSGFPICKLLRQTPQVAGYDSGAVIVVGQKRECIHDESSSNKKSRVTLEIFKPDSHLVQSSQTDPRSNLQNIFTAVSAREVYHHPNLPECYSLAKSWIQKCVSQHARCKQDNYKSPPTRLLELVGDKVYLRRGADMFEDKPLYATLTYCWGMGETMKTTTKTLAQYEGGIELMQLPPTLHDAVIVTQQLDLKCIWIDALCIIQNSQDDWEAECARMGDYYRFSYVTISPLQVLGADNGFLKERPVNPTCPSVVLGGGQFGLRMPIRNDVRGSPLSKRGWTLQERLLATRILHFGEDELLWECVTWTGIT